MELTNNDIIALKFRDEFIKLCKKYSCSLTGNCRDDGEMVLELYSKENNWTYYYGMKDDSHNYSLDKEDDNYDFHNLIELAIINSFNRDATELQGLNNNKISCGVITNNWSKAHLKFQELRSNYNDEDIATFIITDSYMNLVLHSGFWYQWIKPNSGTKGYRCGNIILDKEITLEELEYVILPMCCNCGRNDIELF